ncbi:MAG: MFS transporter, partial [Aggregatilineales bacterium]
MPIWTVLNQYRRIISSRTYFPLWLGQLVSNFGDTLNYVALVVLVYRLSGSGLAVSLTVILEIIPVLLLAPIAGVVIDRFPRKTILVVGDLVRAGLVCFLILANQTWQIYVIVACMTAASVFFNPTLQAIIPNVVAPDALLAANSVAWSTAQLVQIVAAALAGGLIASIGTAAAFGVNAASFVFSALLISQLSIPTPMSAARQESKRGFAAWLDDLRAGLRYARHDRFISRLIVVQALASFAVGATGALLIVLAQQHLRLPPEGFAWLLIAIGLGALLGPIFFGSLVQDYHHVRFLFLPYIIRGVGDILLAIFTPLPIALLILFVYGLNTSTGMVVYNSLMQREVPEEIRGRIYTLMDVVWNFMQLVSLGLGGVLVDRLGVQAIYYVGGTLLIAAGLLGMRLLRDYTFKAPVPQMP